MKKIRLEVPFYSQRGDDVPEEWRERACGTAALKMALGFHIVDGGVESQSRFWKERDAETTNSTYMNRHSNILENVGMSVPSTGELIDAGVALGGYLENVGWRHDALVKLAYKYGLKKTHREEFKKDKQQGIEKLKEMLAQGAIPAVSVSTNHNDPSTFHLVVLVGYDEYGFFYNNPAYREEKEGTGKFALHDDFKEQWRGLVIFFLPKAVL